MSDTLAMTVHVTQDCIDQATLTPQNCPVARATRKAGLKRVHVGHAAVTAEDRDGRTITAGVSPALRQLIHRFDRGAVVTPASYPLCFRRPGPAETPGPMTQQAQRRFHTRQGGPNVIRAQGPGPPRYVSDTDCGDRVPITEVVGHVPSNNAENTCPRCWRKTETRRATQHGIPEEHSARRPTP